MAAKEKTEETNSRITDFFPNSPIPKAETDGVHKSLSKCLKHVANSSVLLTPDSTPTKPIQRHSITTPRRNDLDDHHHNDTESDGAEDLTEGTNQMAAKLTRSQSDSQLDSPRPTKAKLSRSQERTAVVQSPAAKGGRRGKRRGKGKQAEAEVPVVANSTAKPPSSRAKSAPRKKAAPQANKVTDYFPVRRSSRMCTSDIKKMEQDDVIEAILTKREAGLEVVEFEGKGRGVVATKQFKRGEFVVEYAGNLIDLRKAKKLEDKYGENPEIGCYMYYFNFENETYCVDATAESGRLGRLINHSRTEGNCKTRVMGINNRPYLMLVAARQINIGEEVLYDYGDRSKGSMEAHPWLAK